MRAACACCLLLSSSLCWAFVPPGNITRGIYCSAGSLLSTGYWSRHGDGFTITEETAHSGRCSLRCVTTDVSARGSGASQTVRLNQTAPEPLKISGWSKALNVSGDATGHQYSLYVDFSYVDGGSLSMQLATFKPGTHDWEYSETTVKPQKPLASARFYALLRWRTGTVYFDDLFLGPPEGTNLLHNAGFEPEDRTNVGAQQAIYETYGDLNANAMHVYLSGEPGFWTGEEGKGNAEVRGFLETAKQKGLGVWLTTGEPSRPGIKDADDPNFPQYNCVNGPWGEAWNKTLALAAGYDFAGISLVPDEYNWSNGSLKERYAKHADPRVAEFHSKLPEMCNCSLCQALYEKTYGKKLPDLSPGAFPPSQDAAYLRYLQQRYDSTTNWIARGVAAIRQANPAVRTDSLICVSPICSDQWWGTGVAWDRLNETGLDMPTTDPYILLHNYLGDSTHWYVTETAAHLTAATPKRQCGIVLEGSRLRPEYRELDPVEVYGSALSAVCHGARELAWWHYDHLTDASKTTDRSEEARACVRGVYGMLKQADPWLGNLQPGKRVAYLHSRAADDLWRFYTRPTASALLTHAIEDPRYAAVAQHEVLCYLFRRGVPTDLYYLESAQEAQLADYPVIVVPFAFAIADGQAKLLDQLARQGKTVAVISECGPLDQMGRPRERPALLDLCGLQAQPSGEVKGTLAATQPWVPSTGTETFSVYGNLTPAADARVCATVAGKPAILQRQVGKGQVIYLAGAFGYDLVANRNNEKRTRTERIVPNPPASGHVAVLDAVLQQSCGEAPGVLTALQPGKDIEATCLTNDRGELVLVAINWEKEPIETELRVTGSGELQGLHLQSDGTLAESALRLTDGTARVALRAQEAGLWHLVK